MSNRAYKGVVGGIAVLVVSAFVMTLIFGMTIVSADTGPSTDPAKGTLKMRKMLEDLHGATVPYTDFAFTINDGSPINFNADGTIWVPLDPGVYTVKEVLKPGFKAPEYIAHCWGNGVATIEAGTTTYCTIVNKGIAPQLTITKVVENGSSTGSQVSDFRLFAGAVEFTSGVGQSIPVGTYTISEIGPLAEYAGVTSCMVNGAPVQMGSLNDISLALGDVVTCVVTNTKNTPLPPVEPPVCTSNCTATTTATGTCVTSSTTTCNSSNSTTTTATTTDTGAGTTTPTTTPEVVETTTSPDTSGGGGNGKSISLSDSSSGGGGGGGSSNSDPEGEVLGDSDSSSDPKKPQPEVRGAVAPIGAPNTGFGGTSNDNHHFAFILLYLGLTTSFGVWVLRRTTV